MEAPPEIILQIMGISLLRLLISNLMNRKFGLSQESMMLQQERMQMLQEKMMKAQRFNNYELFQETQLELSVEMKDLMKKQMIPMCIRTLIFLGVFGLLRLLYGQYDEIFPIQILIFGKGWAAVYILTSLGASLLIALIKRIFRKGPQKQQFSDIAGLNSGVMSGMQPRPNMGPMLGGGSFEDEDLPEWKRKLQGDEARPTSPANENNASNESTEPEWKKKLT